jgi:hypothetical protein
VVETGPRFIERPAIIPRIVLQPYDDPTAEVGEEHSVSIFFIAVMRNLSRNSLQP